MKQILLIFALFCASYMTVNAQTNTWTGATDTNWGTATNWSLNALPTASNDVIIPTGKTVNLNVATFVKSIVVQGNSTFNIYNNLNFLNASSFATNVTVNWSAASLYGGGTLTNNGTVNLITNGSRYISGATTVINNGLFTMPNTGYLYLYDTSVFNNMVSGVFDLQSDAYVSYNGDQAHSFNNAGLLKKTGGDDVSYFYPKMTNTGTISVESGTLDMYYYGKNFNGGIYNVSSGKALRVSSTGMNISGVLSGTLNGALNWTGNLSVATTATFDFTGNIGVTWTSGSLLGGGTLTNESKISLTSNGSRYISGGTTLANKGTVTMPDTGYLYLYDTSVFNNMVSGVFDLQSDAYVSYNGDQAHSFNNAGLLKKTGGDAVSYFYPKMTNTGTISVESGTLDMYYYGKNFNGGIYNVSSGKTLLVSSTGMNISGTLTGTLNGALNWTGNLSVATTATFDFTGTTGVTWTGGSLLGGGTLTNKSKISLTSNGSRYISGGTTLANKGTVTMPDTGYLYLYDTSVFNNMVSGVFDLQSDAYVSYNGDQAHSFNNAGLLKKTGGDAVSYFYPKMTNTGTISVESGTLDMYYYGKNFNGGIYNVSSGKTLLVSSTGMNISGTLTGTLDGALNWTGNLSVATTASFNFTGETGVTWTSGSLLGGGTLTNESSISLAGGGSRYISGEDTKLINTGTILLPNAGYLYLYNNATLDNQATGLIDFQSDAYISYNGSEAFSIINSGLMQKTGGTGVSYIYPPVTNSGTINASSGELEFVDGFGLTNTVDGIIKGTATIDIPDAAHFTNAGTFAPGGTPGTLTVLGDYKSSATSVLDVELNGLVQSTDYDLLAITGTNVIFDGDVNVTLGFDAAVGNSFTIATVSGTITTKSLTTPFTSDYNGFRHTFNITYPTDKSVKLAVSARVDIQAPTIVTQNVTLQLNASGNATLTPAMVNNGTTDNGSSAANISYSLNKTSFNCSNLGVNTVTLTATDEANNSGTATATVTVVDSINPTVTCGGDLSIDNDGDYTLPNYTTNGVASAADNCGVTLVQSPAPGTVLAAGVYAISFVATDGSSNSANCTFNLTVVDTSLGVNDFELSESSIQLYPNPVRDMMTVKNVSQLELVNGQIMDVTGKTITTFDLKNMGLTREISMENYAAGMYFVKINASNGSVTKRIIKE